MKKPHIRRNRLLANLTIFHLLLFAFVGSLAVWGVMLTSDKHRKTYRQLIAKSRDSQEVEKYQLEQKRNGVKREVLLANEGQRRKMRLRASTGELHLKQGDEGGRLLETLHDVELVVQDKIEASDQEVRYFLAKQALFDYSDQRIFAEDVEVRRYQLPGKKFPENFEKEKPLFTGHAKSVVFNMVNGDVKAHADGLKLNLAIPSRKPS